MGSGAIKELGVIRVRSRTDPKKQPHGRDRGEEKPVKGAVRQRPERQEENLARERANP